MSESKTAILVTEDNFSVAREYNELCENAGSAGAVVMFAGCVRDLTDDNAVNGLMLQHYPGMTEKLLAEVVESACLRWETLAIRIVHRVGELRPGDQIVFVGVAAPHRGDAFDACQYIMDYLKVRATIWKKESRPGGKVWLDDRNSDQEALDRWNP